MKLMTANFAKEDVAVIQKLVSMLKEKQPDITLKKYLKLCVISYTDAVLGQLNREVANNATIQSQEHGVGAESGSDTREGEAGGVAGSAQ